MDQIPLDEFRGLLEVDLNSDERRLVIDGEEPFPEETRGILRFAVGDETAGKAAVKTGLRYDSIVKLRLPDIDLESEEVHTVILRYYKGESLLVLLSGDTSMPRETLNYVIVNVISQLQDADIGASDYLSLARKVEYMGLWVLNQRTRQIEQSVRTPLGDEEFSDADYLSLREYPARLARVEAAARAVRKERPEWQSGKPREAGLRDFIAPRVQDRFYEWGDEAEAEAREAVARLSGLISSQQIVLTQRQAAETARFQRIVTIVGAAILVPGLVAAIFGANVGFHGRESTEAFWAMLLLMAGSGIASFALIRSLETNTWRRVAEHRPIAWLAAASVGSRLVAWSVTAVLLLAAGIALLACAGSP
jgi:CorA-like Mg2+ transporter protein